MCPRVSTVCADFLEEYVGMFHKKRRFSDAYFVTFLKKGKQASSLIAKFCLEKIGANLFKF